MENLRLGLNALGFIRGLHIAKPEGVLTLRGEFLAKIQLPRAIAREHDLNLRTTRKRGQHVFRFTEKGRGGRRGKKLKIEITHFPGRYSPSRVEITHHPTGNLTQHQRLKIVELLAQIAGE